MCSYDPGMASSSKDNRSNKKDTDKHRNTQPAQDGAEVCKCLNVKRHGNLGSSFGGVIFKPNNLPSNGRQSCGVNPQESDTNQLSKPYIQDTSCMVLLDGHDNLFHCTNTHSFMANTCIDRGCACRIGLHKRTNKNTASNCYHNENCIDEQKGGPYIHPLRGKCAEFSDISRCVFVTSKPGYNYCQDVNDDKKYCGLTEDIAGAREISTTGRSFLVNRFIMGDDDYVKEREHHGNISTHSDNIEIGNIPSESSERGNITSGSSESGNIPGGCSESGHLLENFTESGHGLEKFPQVCNGLNSCTDCVSGTGSNVDSGIQSQTFEHCANSARTSMDSNASMASDNVFFPNRSVMNSLSDVTSVSSMSSCQSTTRDTITSRMRFELRHGNHLDHEGSDYMTPSQRKEKELKDLRKERLQLLREQQEKDVEMGALRVCMETLKAQIEEEKTQEMAELVEKLKVSEREKFEQMEALCKVRDELSTMDAKYTNLKRKLSEKEEKFQEYLFDMYKKGQLAAMFEREQELEMLASSQKGRVSVSELTRKLSRTELELAKWQGLKLEESYSVTERPETQAEATLSFLKDSFFHFITSRSDSEDHLRAMITIFQYSDVQMAKIRKGLEDFKRLDRKRLSLK